MKFNRLPLSHQERVDAARGLMAEGLTEFVREYFIDTGLVGAGELGLSNSVAQQPEKTQQPEKRRSITKLRVGMALGVITVGTLTSLPAILGSNGQKMVPMNNSGQVSVEFGNLGYSDNSNVAEQIVSSP